MNTKTARKALETRLRQFRKTYLSDAQWSVYDGEDQIGIVHARTEDEAIEMAITAWCDCGGEPTDGLAVFRRQSFGGGF